MLFMLMYIYICILNISHTHILDSVWKHATVLASSSQQERTDRQPEEFRPWLSDWSSHGRPWILVSAGGPADPPPSLCICSYTYMCVCQSVRTLPPHPPWVPPLLFYQHHTLVQQQPPPNRTVPCEHSAPWDPSANPSTVVDRRRRTAAYNQTSHVPIGDTGIHSYIHISMYMLYVRTSHNSLASLSDGQYNV